MDAKILIPVLPHVKKYLQIQYGPQIIISARSFVPILLLNMLQKRKKVNPSLVKPAKRMIDDPRYVPYPVYISSTHYRKGTYISHRNLRSFNKCLDDMIREEMYRWCHHPNATDMVVDYNIRRFQDWYGFTEDDLPFENLKRWYYRQREEIKARPNIKIKREPELELHL